MKYHNKQTVVDGIKFASKKEAKRYQELKALEYAGVISELAMQVPFVLIPTQRVNGKVVAREVKYVADFCYWRDGNSIVEDVKGFKTPVYKIKRALMLWVHGYLIQEV